MHGDAVGTIFSFREYPAKTRPGMLNTLLSAEFPVVLSQSYSFLTCAQAHGRLAMKSSQMASAEDKAVSQIEGLAEAEDALASNEVDGSLWGGTTVSPNPIRVPKRGRGMI